MEMGASIYVAGHGGMVGSAIVRALRSQGYMNILTRQRADLDLRNQAAVAKFFESAQPDYVFLAAALVGGIVANSERPAEFIASNLSIQTNVIESAYASGVKKLLFLGSSCIYPRLSPQPVHEAALLTGPLEPTNQWYAIAKIAGIKMVQAYRQQYGFGGICLMPCNLYGPGDNYDLRNAHVVPALMRRFHEARINGTGTVFVWGSGEVRRELMHVDDVAAAALLVMNGYDSSEVINAGTGEDLTIRELAHTIARVVDYRGRIEFDRSMPDGTPRKVLDVSRLRTLGWRSRIPLVEGLHSTYRWFVEQGPER